MRYLALRSWAILLLFFMIHLGTGFQKCRQSLLRLSIARQLAEDSRLIQRSNNYSVPLRPVAANSKGIIPVGPQSLTEAEKLQFDSDKPLSKQSLKYYEVVNSLAPNEMLMKFAQSAPKNVQAATKTTIMNLLGSLPNYALDAVLMTTNVKLANLLYQMQVTGYMFKSAEYRMSLTRSLRGLPRLPPPSALKKDGQMIPIDVKDGQTIPPETSSVVKVRSVSGEEVSVPVEELTAALSNEVSALRRELATIKDERENELKSNLLTYIQALPEKELSKLTADMGEDVLQAIQLLVDAVMDRLKVPLPGQSEETVVAQNVANLAQLCMWQMVMGYKLRELEALEKGVPFD